MHAACAPSPAPPARGACTSRTPEADDARRAWLPLSEGLNAVTRSMGRDDLYPFVLAPAVVEKLRLVQDLISRRVVPAQAPLR